MTTKLSTAASRFWAKISEEWASLWTTLTSATQSKTWSVTSLFLKTSSLQTARWATFSPYRCTITSLKRWRWCHLKEFRAFFRKKASWIGQFSFWTWIKRCGVCTQTPWKSSGDKAVPFTRKMSAAVSLPSEKLCSKSLTTQSTTCVRLTQVLWFSPPKWTLPRLKTVPSSVHQTDCPL